MGAFVAFHSSSLVENYGLKPPASIAPCSSLTPACKTLRIDGDAVEGLLERIRRLLIAL